MKGIATFILVPWLLFTAVNWSSSPQHMTMNAEYSNIASEEFVGMFHGKDTSLLHDLQLHSDTLGGPLLYSADIQTPVCIDNICKPMYIQLYWNLIGNYVGYKQVKGQPLTKYDHDLFEETDHLQLHQLLRDKHSILERRALSDLFDPNKEVGEQIEYKGQKVDGISGATHKEISESVVSGALFSCYSAWHLANGEVVKVIKTNLDSLINPKLLDYFLNSQYQDYQYFAIRQLESEGMVTSLPRIIDIYPDANSLTRSYILKKLPITAWTSKESASSIFNLFGISDINARTLMIKHLERSHDVAYSILSTQIPVMTRNQLIDYLAALGQKPDLVADVKPALQEVVDNGEYTYGYLVEEFLAGG